MQSKELLNLADTIEGEINRMCVTDDTTELYNMYIHAEQNIFKLYSMRYEDLRKGREEKPKKKLTFSERLEIAKTYREWITSNNVAYCPESFLAYLSIEGYIDG